MNVSPRTCLWSFFFVLLALSLPVNTFAAYLESDFPAKTKKTSVSPTPRVPEFRPPRPIPRPPRPIHENAAMRLLRQVEIGAPYRHQHLTIYPVNLRHGAHTGLRTLDEALGNAWINIEESGRAVVSQITVRNTSRHHIFLMAGEAIHGGKQNRIISHDVILPPRSGAIAIPVYCVEQHRWSHPTGKFESKKNLAHPTLRSGAARRASQDSIWREVESRSKAAGVDVPTRNYEALYANAEVKDKLAKCLPRFHRFRGRQTVGAVAVVGRRVVGADLFADPELFGKQWDKLLRSYALEYISHPHPLPLPAPRKGDRRRVVPAPDVRGFLNRAISARYTSRGTPGAGTLYQISGAASGETMVWNGNAVHVALFGTRAVIDRPYPRPHFIPEPRR